MCRFFAYKGNPVLLKDLLITPGHSILKQSYEAKERKEPLNGDGFGIGWYNYAIDKSPAVFKEITPAWSNRNLMELSSKIVSGQIFAHVRAATEGLSVNELNCHPFKYKNLLWMHNGKVNAFIRIKRRMLDEIQEHFFERIEGNTDSEYAFALFLSILNPDQNACYTHEDMVHALRLTIKKIIELNKGFDGYSSLNFAVTDGTNFVFSRHTNNPDKNPPTLYYTYGKEFTIQGTQIKITDKTGQNFFMVASEAVDNQNEEWFEIPKNHIFSINNKSEYFLNPI